GAVSHRLARLRVARYAVTALRAALADLAEAVRIRRTRIVEAGKHVERRVHGVDEPLDAARPWREVERANQRRGDLDHAERQTLGETEPRLEVMDVVAALLEARELRRGRDRIVEVTERVDEPALERGSAGPDAPACDAIHLLDAAAAMHRDAADEPLVCLDDGLPEDVANVVAETAQQIVLPRERRRADAVDVDAEPAQRALEGRKHAGDADRPGQRRRARPDLVGRHRDPIAAGRGDAAHRYDDRTPALLEYLDLAKDDLGRERAAAGTVDAQHERFHFFVIGRFANQLRGRIAADPSRRLAAVHDLARQHDHADAAASEGRRGGADGAQVLVVADRREAALVFRRADRLADPAAHAVAVHQLVDETVLARELGRITVRGTEQRREIVCIALQRVGR